MPVLSNPRHERFAQELAKGMSQTEAYKLAGYSASDETARRTASVLMTKHDVVARVAELQQRGAVRAEVTVESLIGEAEEARLLAVKLNNPAAAVAAIREKGVLSGKRIERSERGQPGEFEGMNADELRDYVAREAAALGLGDGHAAPEGRGARPSGKPH